jgi:hypothetical protein
MGREPHPGRLSPNRTAVCQQTLVTPNRAPQQAKKSFAAKSIVSGYPTGKPAGTCTCTNQQQTKVNQLRQNDNRQEDKAFGERPSPK